MGGRWDPLFWSEDFQFAGSNWTYVRLLVDKQNVLTSICFTVSSEEYEPVEYMISHGILNHGPFDASVHPTATISDLNADKIAWFVGLARERRQFPLQYSHENIPQILNSLHLLTEDGRLKNAALLLFAKDTHRNNRHHRPLQRCWTSRAIH